VYVIKFVLNQTTFITNYSEKITTIIMSEILKGDPNINMYKIKTFIIKVILIIKRKSNLFSQIAYAIMMRGVNIT